MKSAYLLLAATLLTCPLLAEEKAPTPALPGEEPQKDQPKLIPALEKDLKGTYLQVQTGGLLEFLPGGKIAGFPTTGSYKFLAPGQVEMYGKQKDGAEERTPVRIYRTPYGLGLVRNVHGDDEPTNLTRLDNVPAEPDKWAGPAVIHLLLAMDKRAQKRNVNLDKEGYFRTAEGGYYFRIYKGPSGSALGYSTELGQSTFSLQLKKAGSMLVAYDELTNPKFLAIIQLDAKLDNPVGPKAEKPTK
jgi:hypothetical protein